MNPIILSPELVEILFSMESQSEIARMLIHQDFDKSILVENHPNFIGVSKDDRIKISYLPFDRINTTEDKWNGSRRIMAKPGVFLRKIFKEVSDKEVETFATLYKNLQTRPDFEFKIVEGSDIRKWYYYENYYSQESSLGNSCMKHRNCQSYFDIYVTNPNVKMLIMLKDNLLLGRAILWMNATDVDGIEYKVMDRIYTISDEDYAFHFRKWAEDNGFLYKKEQKWNNTLYFINENKPILKRLSVKIDVSDISRYPYMDTFKFLDKLNGIAYNFKPIGSHLITISSAEGTYQSSETLIEDGISNLFHYQHEMAFIDYKNFWTLSNDNVRYSDVYDKYILLEDAQRHEFLGYWIFKDDSLNDMKLINQMVEEEKRLREQRERRLEETRRRLSEEKRLREQREREASTVDPSNLNNLQGGWERTDWYGEGQTFIRRFMGSIGIDSLSDS